MTENRSAQPPGSSAGRKVKASSGAQFVKLTSCAAEGDRVAARELILGGWWPQGWDADNETVLDVVIDGSRRTVGKIHPDDEELK